MHHCAQHKNSSADAAHLENLMYKTDFWFYLQPSLWSHTATRKFRTVPAQHKICKVYFSTDLITKFALKLIPPLLIFLTSEIISHNHKGVKVNLKNNKNRKRYLDIMSLESSAV